MVKLAVAPAGLDDLGLLLQAEVLPRVARPDNVPEQCEDLVMRDGARVGEVVDACIAVLGQKNRRGQQVVQDGVAVGNVDDAVVLGNLGDKIAWVEVVRDRHSQPQDEAVGVVFHDLDSRVSEPTSQPGPFTLPLALAPGAVRKGREGVRRCMNKSFVIQLTSSTCALVSE